MATLLKQSTEIKVRVGPFVDVGDGFTPETGVALSTADEAELLKSNGAGTVDISGATWAAVTGADGWYDLTLTTSHTDTLGELVVVVQDDSVCLPVFARFQVVPANVYDSLVGGTDSLEVDATAISGSATAANNAEVVFDTDFATNYNTTNDKWQTEATVSGNVDLNADQSGVTIGTVNAATLADGAHGGASTTITLQTPIESNAIQISGDTTAADNLELDYDGTGYDKTASSVGAIRVNTAQAGAAGTITLDASASATNDLYNGALITIRSGTGAGQSRWIYDYVGSTKVASVSRDWTTNPSSDSVFVILPSSHPLLDDIADLDDFTASAAAKLALITSGTSINIQSTITDGDVFTILQGETRDFTDGNHIRIDVDGTVTDLTGYTPKFAFTKLTSNSGTSSLELSGTVVNAGLSTQYIYFEMTEAQTEALALDTSATHPYRLSSNYAYRWDASSTDGVSNCPGHGTGYVSVKAMATTC